MLQIHVSVYHFYLNCMFNLSSCPAILLTLCLYGRVAPSISCRKKKKRCLQLIKVNKYYISHNKRSICMYRVSIRYSILYYLLKKDAKHIKLRLSKLSKSLFNPAFKSALFCHLFVPICLSLGHTLAPPKLAG